MGSLTCFTMNQSYQIWKQIHMAYSLEVGGLEKAASSRRTSSRLRS